MDYFVDRTKLDYFVFNNKSSASINFIITENDNLKSFERDFEVVEIQGRDGELIVDNNRRKNKEINIAGYVDLEGLGDAAYISNLIDEWLMPNLKFNSLIFSNDMRKYEAIVKGVIDKEEVVEGLLSVKFKFSCKEVI